MPKIIIDGKEIECREKVPVLQAALEAGWEVPHYCYHAGLSVVASCRLCLMEMKMPHPQTKEMGWAPKLFPSCQTPVREGLEVRFCSDKVSENQRECMEYFLLNHPLDCPVCDQAGECYLQDYSRRFGNATSQMVEPKNKNPKKDIGSRTLLYQDRCVMCSRCVRFCDEVAGTGELAIVNRGHEAEIDVFPGVPLENALQGNVVDICPVGSLLDKDFLMDQRVWFLKEAKSVCPGCSAGCAIHVDQNDDHVWRLKPRFNPGVNDWWMCDAGRFGWKYVHDDQRVNRLAVRRGAGVEQPDWDSLPEIAAARFGGVVAREGTGKLAAVLSPFMSCEEAWLLGTFIRGIDPEATLVMGPVPVDGEDETFPQGNGSPVRFTIRAEKCPNRRGIEMVLAGLGGAVVSFEAFETRAAAGDFAGAWIVGGYPREWVRKQTVSAAGKIGLLIVQDILPNKLTEAAGVLIPSCSWAERSGCFVNCDGKIQAFEAAIAPLEGCRRDGQFLYALAGEAGLYHAATVRDRMAESMPQFGALHVAPEVPQHVH